MNRTTRTITLTALLAVAATLTACTDPEEPPITLPSATSSSSAPSPTASVTSTTTPQQQILDVYLGMQRAFLKASETANPDDPELPRYTAGTALKRLRDGLTSMRQQGLRGRGEAIFQPKVESFQPADAPTKARVRDCMDTSRTQRYKANGDPYKDTPGGLRLVIADLERVDGAWKVTGLGVHEVGSCKLESS
ncbi:hypothetical protein GCM10022225_26380 [Plantactinospora mayteni]|uniref:Secreted protein/lipoprotein n=1 Tax=Plantactinospora mayteni TaxID=566021 RepID=A0ABQ4EIR0_9ACTN|nr:hypothetical protein [Plantactinospora mayteni]GIG94632.1 hypothetical protein Pma05_12050 [Plantactinospora mayteni]